MTFRISKYSYNSWKTFSQDKNLMILGKIEKISNQYYLLFLLFGNMNVYGGVSFYRWMVRENRLVSEKVRNCNYKIFF